VKGRQTHFLLGWVGLASTPFSGKYTTADWLFRVLGEMNAVELTIEQISERLGVLATAHFSNLSTPDKDKHTTFVLAGWQQGEPFICTISNYISVHNRISPSFDLRHHIPTIKESANIVPKFDVTIQRFKEINDGNYLVHVMGDFNPEDLQPHFMGLERLLKNRAAGSEITGVCVQIALKAAEHSETIGRNLIGVEMDMTGRIVWTHRTETDEVPLPVYLGLDGCHKQASLTLISSSNGYFVRARAKVAKFEKKAV
jgi:hypothetical protein